MPSKTLAIRIKTAPIATRGATRRLHTSRRAHASLITPQTQHQHHPLISHTIQQPVPKNDSAFLGCLPLSQVLRTYFIASISSSPTLLAASSKALLRCLNSSSWITNVEKNPVLNLALRETFYKQFCAGDDKPSARKSMKVLENIGFTGVILEYALEVLQEVQGSDEVKDIQVWRRGLLDSIDMARAGDFIGLKWSGMGTSALRLMKADAPPSEPMLAAMHEVCSAAKTKGVALLPAAEETNTLAAFLKWSQSFQREYNRGHDASAVVYSTYQAYLKQTPAAITSHLADAAQRDYTLGAKIVRGAYLANEEKSLLHDSKEATDAAYDAITTALLGRSAPSAAPPSQPFPRLNLVLATHNAVSARKAMAFRREQLARGEQLVPLVYAQLQGMADEVSCELLAAGRGEGVLDAPKVFKCTTWGSMDQCLNYLLRRAAENKDAAGRTLESRLAMGKELRRRMWAGVGLA